MDVMICGYDHLTDEKKEGNTINNFRRSNSWKSYYTGMNSIQEWTRANPTIDYRYLFQQKYPSSDSLNFNNSTTWPL
jgi:hypothetical protein